MKKRRRRLGAAPRPFRPSTTTSLKCMEPARKALQQALRIQRSKGRTNCHDIVVECTKSKFDGSGRLRVRARCIDQDRASEFKAMAEGYADSIRTMFE